MAVLLSAPGSNMVTLKAWGAGGGRTAGLISPMRCQKATPSW
jgi:hypothetical protein